MAVLQSSGCCARFNLGLKGQVPRIQDSELALSDIAKVRRRNLNPNVILCMSLGTLGVDWFSWGRALLLALIYKLTHCGHTFRNSRIIRLCGRRMLDHICGSVHRTTISRELQTTVQRTRVPTRYAVIRDYSP